MIASKSQMVVIFLICGVINFTWAQSKKEERKKQKTERLEMAYAEAKSLIASGNFEFIANWASPLDIDVIQIGGSLPGGNAVFLGGRVDLTGNSNYLRLFNGSNADIVMPYFGRSFYADRSLSDSGIEFKGEISKYKIKFNDKKRRITITFKSKNKRDSFSYQINIYSLTSVTLQVSGARIQPISYNGIIKALNIE